MRKKLKKRLRPSELPNKTKRNKNARAISVYNVWKNWRSRTLLLAGMFALIIGTFFGMMTLYIFNEEDETTFTISNSNEPEVSGKEQRKRSEMYEVQPLSFYVIQAGMFQEKQNAESEQKRLQKERISSFVWKRDDHYFVLLSAHETEKNAQSRIDSFDKEELFVKKWETVVSDIHSSEVESALLETFYETYMRAIVDVDKKNDFDRTLWDDVIRKEDVIAQDVHELQKELATVVEKVERDDAPTMLLHIAYIYEQIAEALK
ncbi:MAG TPA: hypothetical protein VK029_02005 [Pseudogracilibacillus sp.]|nr:hypothetical protein [Pseudogracilibacillus sp.]